MLEREGSEMAEIERAGYRPDVRAGKGVVCCFFMDNYGHLAVSGG
jgi:hypothetical protein